MRMPEVDAERREDPECDEPGCAEAWAWSTDDGHLLCEGHYFVHEHRLAEGLDLIEEERHEREFLWRAS